AARDAGLEVIKTTTFLACLGSVIAFKKGSAGLAFLGEAPGELLLASFEAGAKIGGAGRGRASVLTAEKAVESHIDAFNRFLLQDLEANRFR
ncbi:unnamed protein product, partial [marine sediment metagenome]